MRAAIDGAAIMLATSSTRTPASGAPGPGVVVAIYRPCQRGGRFSAKARGPSRASSLARRRASHGAT